VVFAQDATKQPHPPDTIAGRWIVSADFYGSPLYFMMELEQTGEKLSGNFDGDKLEATSPEIRSRFWPRMIKAGRKTQKAHCRTIRSQEQLSS